MAKTITLKFPGTCADKQCGVALKIGDRGRWYGRGQVYGIDCHDKFDGGLRWAAGRAVQGNGMCEDAPACGCCGPEGLGAM